MQKSDIFMFTNLRYLRLKLQKSKENNNFKNIICYVTSEVSLKGFYFTLSDVGLILNTLELAYIGVCIQTLHLHIFYSRTLQILSIQLKSFIAKRLNSILVNLRYLRFKLLKYKENNKKNCNTFDHNFKNIPLYIMRKVSLERYYFVLYDCALTSQISKMALKSFCDKTLQLLFYFLYILDCIVSVIYISTLFRNLLI